MKKIFLIVALGFAAVFLIISSVRAADDNFKKVVQIKTYAQNDESFLELQGTGSGFIISSDGLVLTNHHVVTVESEFADLNYEAVFLVCLTEESGGSPDCHFTGRLVASDEAKDVALLRIQPITSLTNQSSFEYFDLASEEVADGADITALGFPWIGGDSLTSTEGVVSGFEEKNGNTWIKTDAVTSFGSSGGAAINDQDQVVGITSAAASDALNGLGYIISIQSLKPWINTSRSQPASKSSLEDSLIAFNKTMEKIKTGNDFSYDNGLAYSLTKPDDWEFSYDSEDTLFIVKSSDFSGLLMSAIVRTPYVVSADNLDQLATVLIDGFTSSGSSINKNELIDISGFNGKKIQLLTDGELMTIYIIPAGDYLFVMASMYNDEEAKASIQSIIDSLVITKTDSPQSWSDSYINPYHDFAFKTNKDWVLRDSPDFSEPMQLISRQDMAASISLGVETLSSDVKEMSGPQYFNYLESQLKANKAPGDDYTFRLFEVEGNVSLSNDLQDGAYLAYDIYTKEADGSEKLKIKGYVYYFQHQDKLYRFALGIYAKFIDNPQQLLADFRAVMKGFAWGSTPPSTPALAETVSVEPAPATDTTTADTETDADTDSDDSTQSESDDQSQSQTQVQVSDQTKSTIQLKQRRPSLAGKIMLRVEANGEAYYVHPQDNQAYFLGRPSDAFAVMRSQGVGITNADLAKITVGFAGTSSQDSDGDGLSDMLEDALGTDPDKLDSDGDSYDDGTEIATGYNPLSNGRMAIDADFARAQAGRILLQVEANGEAWYVNPADHRRYFLGRPADAFAIMRQLGLGISEANFSNL